MSVSSYHKSRAGTAYSVAHRLEKFGFLRAVTDADEPKDKRVEVTTEGQGALRDWISTGPPMIDIAHSADLLRLRFNFLGAVSQEDRLVFIDRSLAGLETMLDEGTALIAKNQAINEYFGALSAVAFVLETRARIQWLTLVKELVMHPLDETADWSKELLNRTASVDVTG